MASDVADAVHAEIAESTFSLPVKAIRAYRHDQTLPEGKEIRVSVVPNGITMTPAARAVCSYTIEIYVVVTRKVGDARPETITPLLGVVEEVIEFFRLRRLEKYPAAIWTGTELKPMVSSEHLENLKQFTSLITLTLKVVR